MKAEAVIDSIVKKLVETIDPKAIILFGSLAKGKNHENSDIDLLIVWDEEKGLNNTQRRIKLRKLLGFVEVPIDILTCTSEELKEAMKDDKSFTANIVKEGKVIYGRLNPKVSC